MSKNSNPLALARTVLRAVRVLNLVYAAGIAMLLLATVVAPDGTFAALGVRTESVARMGVAMRAMAVVGIAGAVIAHLVLSQLLAIVDSVRDGDPFVIANARRLQSIAWLVFVGELLHLVVGALAVFGSTPAQSLDVDWSFSFTPWIAVLMLFVLARVFEHGARLRADLEGTV
jgi:hypothetical protein